MKNDVTIREKIGWKNLKIGDCVLYYYKDSKNQLFAVAKLKSICEFSGELEFVDIEFISGNEVMIGEFSINQHEISTQECDKCTTNEWEIHLIEVLDFVTEIKAKYPEYLI